MKKNLVVLVSILFLVCAVTLQLITIMRADGWSDSYQIYGLVVVILGTVGSIISIFIPSSYVCRISPSDWGSEKGNLSFTIPARKHGMGKYPKVATYAVNTDGSRSVVKFAVTFCGKGDIRVFSAMKCDSVIEAVVT